MSKVQSKAVGLAVALTLTLGSVLSCQTLTRSPVSAPLSQSQQLSLQTAHGTINLQIELPYPKAYDALKRYHFGTKMLEEGRINKMKLSITNVLDTDFKAEKVVSLTQGGLKVKLEVPLGKNYIITVQGMDDLNEVAGAQVKGVFSVASATTNPDVEVNPLSTAVAKVVEEVQATDKEMASKIDTERLKALIVEGKSAASPFLVNTAAFSAAIVAAKGEVPRIVPAKPVLAPGRIKGKLTGLEPGNAAIIFTTDPVSKPFIVVAPPVAAASGTTTTTDTELEFRLDNLPPGDWSVKVVASGYEVKGDEVDSEVFPTKEITITAGAETTTDFEITKLSWGSTPINASGIIGSSDQPDAEVDGSDSIHLVWRQDGVEEDDNSGSIFYSRWNGRTWSTANRFISPAGVENFKGARRPAVTYGVDRSPHIIWSASSDNAQHKGRRILFSRFDGVKWTQPQIISTSTPTQEVKADNPDIAVNLVNGRIFAVWDQLNGSSGEVYFSEYDGKNWNEPLRLSSSSTSAQRPRMAIGTDGRIHVVWQIKDTRTTQYTSWDGRQFSAIESIPFKQLGDADANRSNLDIRTDLLNRAHIIWRNGNELQYILRSGNAWLPAEQVDDIQGVDLPVLSESSLFIDNIGNVNVLWISSYSNGTPIVRYRRRISTGWELPASATSSSPSPSATAFATPTPDPTGTPAPAASASSSASVFPGYDDLPATENKRSKTRPLILVDTRGMLSAIWSNSESDPVNSEIYHSRKLNSSD